MLSTSSCTVDVRTLDTSLLQSRSLGRKYFTAGASAGVWVAKRRCAVMAKQTFGMS
jgi:hypothetical protein